MYVTAIAYETSLYRTLPGPRTSSARSRSSRSDSPRIDAERYPTLAALGPTMTLGDGDERFELGMDVLINGLLATQTEGRLTATPFGDGAAGASRRDAR